MSRSILVFSPGSLGDTLILVPALQFIRENHKNDILTVLFDTPRGRSKLTPELILERTGIVDYFLEYGCEVSDKKLNFGYALSLLKLYSKLVFKFDEVYYLVEAWRGDSRIWRDKLFFRLCGIRRLRYFDRILAKPDPFIRTYSRSSEGLYRVGLDGSLALSAQSQNYNFRFQKNGARVKRRRAGEYVLSPYSNMQAKNWPLDRYVSVVNWLKDEYNVTPILFGSSDDEFAAEELIGMLGFGISYCGKLAFSETISKIEECDFYFGNDSGLMHLSAAIGLPCFAIFSARDYLGRWLPLGSGHVTLRDCQIECSGCLLSICNNEIENKCLKTISVEYCISELRDFMTYEGSLS